LGTSTKKHWSNHCFYVQSMHGYPLVSFPETVNCKTENALESTATIHQTVGCRWWLFSGNFSWEEFEGGKRLLHLLDFQTRGNLWEHLHSSFIWLARNLATPASAVLMTRAVHRWFMHRQ